VDTPPETDSQELVALALLDRALAWYAEQDRQVLGSLLAQGTFLSHEAIADARAALARRGALTAAQFDALVRFTHVMPELARVNPGAPDCNLGDMATALRVVPPQDDAPWSWSWQPTPDAAVLAKLEVRETSLGIAQNQRANREAWWSHAERSRTFIEDTADLCGKRALAVVLGVGPGSDVPLVNLAKRFERLLLIDIDEAQLAETVARLFTDAALRDRVQLQAMDLTGVNQLLIHRVDQLLDSGGNAAQVGEQLNRLARSYRLAALPAILPAGQRADLIVSSCVMSQVSWPQRRYTQKMFEQRFGRYSAPAQQSSELAWKEFEVRVQQDHLNGLAAQADVVALICDTINHRTALDHAGTERERGVNMYFLHARSLRDRVPKFITVERTGGWPWSLLKATRKNPEGVRVDVEALGLSSS
jgi:hypothetical protein